MTAAPGQLRGGWRFTAVAVLLLSLGVGAATAALTLVNGFMPHSAPMFGCETMAGRAVDPSLGLGAHVPTRLEVQERIAAA
ncbi:MAG: hypothetical protein JJD97_00945 [Gemmatimonadaceae bacterium]|nr:hypothetical protein [Gemmatimonadaceae bacterium]